MVEKTWGRDMSLCECVCVCVCLTVCSSQVVGLGSLSLLCNDRFVTNRLLPLSA